MPDLLAQLTMDGEFLFQRSLAETDPSQRKRSRPPQRADLPKGAPPSRVDITVASSSVALPGSSSKAPPHSKSSWLQPLGVDTAGGTEATRPLKVGRCNVSSKPWPSNRHDTVAAGDEDDRSRATTGLLEVMSSLEGRGATLRIREFANTDELLRIMLKPRKAKTTTAGETSKTKTGEVPGVQPGSFRRWARLSAVALSRMGEDEEPPTAAPSSPVSSRYSISIF